MIEPNGQPIAFFSKTYEETLGMLSEARDYITCEQPLECQAMTPIGRAALMQETTRLVARLTQVMAWLLVQKAVYGGEMTRAQALEDVHRLGGKAVCLAAECPPSFAPTQRFATLLDRSRRLYIRVARLDELLERQAI